MQIAVFYYSLSLSDKISMRKRWTRQWKREQEKCFALDAENIINLSAIPGLLLVIFDE